MLPMPKPKPAMDHPTPSNSLTLLLLLLLIFVTFIQAIQGTSTSHPSPARHVPVPTVVYRSVERVAVTTAAAGDESPGGGGSYEPFELCMGCRCCQAASSTSCVDTRCCYAIDCNVPGKPFGVCAFSPRTCGCGSDDAGNEGSKCDANQ